MRPLPHPGMTLIELAIAMLIITVVTVAVAEALISTQEMEAVQSADDELAHDAARIQALISQDLAASGWHWAAASEAVYSTSVVADDRRMVYYPFVLQQGSSPGLPGDPASPTPAIHGAADLDPANPSVPVNLLHTIRSAALVDLHLPESLLPGEVADATTFFSAGGVAARLRYATSYYARSQELVFLKIATGAWSADPQVENAPVLSFAGTSAQWATPTERDPSTGELRPWNAFAHDDLRILRMWDWDVVLHDVSGDLQRLGYRDATHAPANTPAELVRTNRVEDVVLSGSWLNTTDGVSLVPRWQTKVADPKWFSLGGRIAPDDLREYMYCVIPCPPEVNGLGRLVRCYSVDFTKNGHPADLGQGVKLGQWVSRWSNGTVVDRAMVIDEVISDDVVRIVCDTRRTDSSLGLNEIRIRVYMARASIRDPQVILRRVVESTVTMRTNNNTTANDANQILVGPGVPFPY